MIPSTTIFTSANVAERDFPFPNNIPARLFLECILVQVTIKSPIPESPANVSAFPPIAIPNLDISVIPLVISAALVLSPKPRPSDIPAANAIIFFNAAPISTPITSLLVYSLKLGFINSFCIIFAISFSSVAMTQAVGIHLPTSSAWLGPDNTHG